MEKRTPDTMLALVGGANIAAAGVTLLLVGPYMAVFMASVMQSASLEATSNPMKKAVYYLVLYPGGVMAPLYPVIASTLCVATGNPMFLGLSFVPLAAVPLGLWGMSLFERPEASPSSTPWSGGAVPVDVPPDIPK